MTRKKMIMKKLFIKILALVLLSNIFSSCKKTLKDDYLNPDLVTQGSIGNLFTGMLFNNRIHSSYWDYYT
ncbi:MAG: SusD/RagB family nutrient-binding outer membrane lipoprotein, partial [Pseudopedobacter saltans]